MRALDRRCAAGWVHPRLTDGPDGRAAIMAPKRVTRAAVMLMLRDAAAYRSTAARFDRPESYGRRYVAMAAHHRAMAAAALYRSTTPRLPGGAR